MIHIIEVLSKYIMIGILALFTLESCVLLFRQGKQKNGFLHATQILCIFAYHLFGFLTIAFAQENYDYFFMYAFEVILLFAIFVLFTVIFPKCNRALLNNMCMLFAIGSVILARLSLDKAIKQFAIMVISFFIAMCIPYLLKKIKWIKDMGFLFASFGIFALGMVLVIGTVTYGSKLSFTIFDITFQPSEVIKIIFIFFLAALLSKPYQFKNVVLATIGAAIHVLILVASRDLGSAVIYYVVYVVVLYVATKKPLYLIGGISAAALASYVAYMLFPHVQERVAAWKDPWTNIDNVGYQNTQSLFAIGTGGWFGLGLHGGSPESIPLVEVDFIFSAISEEMGAITGICLILISLCCVFLMIRLAIIIKDKFYSLVVLGLAVMYGFQIFLTIGGGIKLIPLTGVTLPFISYGGTSVLATTILFLVVQGIYLLYQDQKPTVKLSIKEKLLVNKEYYIIIGIIGIGFAWLLGYFIHFIVAESEYAINNEYNPRQEILASRTTRGRIISSDNVVLAETIINSYGFEQRIYPYHELFSHIVGYDSHGKMGLEWLGNYQLLSSDIALAAKVENDINGVKNPGNDLIATLDYDLQQAASDALFVYNGAVVVMDVKTGKVLAMVSKPEFDPNNIDEIWDELLVDNGSSELLNRATQGLYPLGSSFKIITSLAYIREHENDIDSYEYNCTGSISIEGERIQCYDNISHGWEGLLDSFADSCNTSFVNIGLGLDRDNLNQLLSDLYFNQEIPLQLPVSTSSLIIDELTTTAEMMQLSIGQGTTLCTPIQMAMIASAIGNNGVMMKPYFVDSVVSADGNVVKQYKPSELGTVMTETESDLLTELMSAVITQGTGRDLKGTSYTSAGKTGSAEYNGNKADSHAWFVGFAPAEEPEIAVAIIVEGAGTGGDSAVPMAKQIFDVYFGEE